MCVHPRLLVGAPAVAGLGAPGTQPVPLVSQQPIDFGALAALFQAASSFSSAAATGFGPPAVAVAVAGSGATATQATPTAFQQPDFGALAALFHGSSTANN